MLQYSDGQALELASDGAGCVRCWCRGPRLELRWQIYIILITTQKKKENSEDNQRSHTCGSLLISGLSLLTFHCTSLQLLWFLFASILVSHTWVTKGYVLLKVHSLLWCITQCFKMYTILTLFAIWNESINWAATQRSPPSAAIQYRECH